MERQHRCNHDFSDCLTSGWSRLLLLSRFLLEVKVWGRSRAKTRANLACGRTHRQLIRGVIAPQRRRNSSAKGENGGIYSERRLVVFF